MTKLLTGKRLKALRSQRNMGQQELCSVLGLNRNTYAQYEQGRRHPDCETLWKIADYYGCTVDYILGRSDHLECVCSGVD